MGETIWPVESTFGDCIMQVTSATAPNVIGHREGCVQAIETAAQLDGERVSAVRYPTAGTVSYSGSGLRFVGTAHQRVSSVDVVRCRLAQWCAASSTWHRHRASC